MLLGNTAQSHIYIPIIIVMIVRILYYCYGSDVIHALICIYMFYICVYELRRYAADTRDYGHILLAHFLHHRHHLLLHSRVSCFSLFFLRWAHAHIFLFLSSFELLQLPSLTVSTSNIAVYYYYYEMYTY